jgi:TetR/AcrR family transcriptional repressor of nem operon
MMFVMLDETKHDDYHATCQASEKKTMRYPAAETAEKHARILDAASELFRKGGFSSVSVGEIMRATGLTHGPFYNHFASKEALMAASIEHASAKALADIDAVAAVDEGLQKYLQSYLSVSHRDAPESGCLMAALGPEIGREPGLRSAFTAHLRASIDRFRKYLPSPSEKAARANAVRTLASLVGAMVLARAVDDDALSREILRDVTEGLGSR